MRSGSDAQIIRHVKHILKTEKKILFMNYCIHNVPGRMHIKVPEIKGNPKWLQSVKTIVEDIKGVGEISLNQITGSVFQ